MGIPCHPNNIDFFGPEVGCQVNQGSYGMALNTLLRS